MIDVKKTTDQMVADFGRNMEGMYVQAIKEAVVMASGKFHQAGYLDGSLLMTELETIAGEVVVSILGDKNDRGGMRI